VSFAILFSFLPKNRKDFYYVLKIGVEVGDFVLALYLLALFGGMSFPGHLSGTSVADSVSHLIGDGAKVGAIGVVPAISTEPFYPILDTSVDGVGTAWKNTLP
jgi:hypothetical protein